MAIVTGNSDVHHRYANDVRKHRHCCTALALRIVCIYVLANCGMGVEPTITSTSNKTETKTNVLFVVVDNLRPALGAYGVTDAVTPRIDALANESTLFSRAFCQEAWCSPSRNSFLSGRLPSETQAFNFLDSFRQLQDGSPGPGVNWVTLPQYFKQHGYYTTSSGKVFHPRLPPNFDYPMSWSDVPTMQEKANCNSGNGDAGTMVCAFNESVYDADYMTTSAAILRLQTWKQNETSNHNQPFFAAVGLQGPRLPWSFPASVLSRLPKLEDTTLALHQSSPSSDTEDHEWFRPVEIAGYADVVTEAGVTHQKPLSKLFQQRVRQAYYATATHADVQVGRLLDELVNLDIDDDTVIVFTADHAQNLGEENMWSMMNLLETSLRVPLMIRPAPREQRQLFRVYSHPVELVDLYPTLASLASLPSPPESWKLPGSDLSKGLTTGAVVKPVDAAFSQITRCHNCTQAYEDGYAGCTNDSVDATKYLVACAKTPRSLFDFMGMTIRTTEWRYSVYCTWNGKLLVANLSDCVREELFFHGNDTTLYNVDTNGEHTNVVSTPAYSSIRAKLHNQVVQHFSGQIL